MKRFGLIGRTLKHSFSKNYFTEKFNKENIQDCAYENFELPTIEQLPQLISNNRNICGLNVTIPYKESVLQYLKNKDEVVEKICACNCIKIVKNELHGFNTDIIGFTKSLKPKLKPIHKKALILGSGGASKAVQYALNDLMIDYLVVSRHKKFNQLGYEDLGEDVMKEHTIIINTTPLGMFPNTNDDPPIPYNLIGRQHLLYDLIYNPPETKFLQKGKERGAQTLNGQEMLIIQAEESWRIWNE